MKKQENFILAMILFLIITLCLNTLFIYLVYKQSQENSSLLQSQINKIKGDTEFKFSEINKNLNENLNAINSLDTRILLIDEEFNLLKASASSDFSGIIEESIKSVVTVRTDKSQGTGFIINNQGYIITNLHVLEEATRLNVITYEQGIKSSLLIGYSEELDLALLKIEGEYDSLELANSDKIQIGEKVIAIGNPLGLQFSVSEGIISAIHREGISNLEAYIQTDAALNPGNSGGPLINNQGKVVGINNFKISSGENLGFALESNYIKETINEISLQQLNQTLV